MNEVCMYNNNNKQTFWENWKKTLQINIVVNGLYYTRLLGLTQSSVIWIIHHNVSLKCFFIYLNVVSLGVLTFMFYKVV